MAGDSLSILESKETIFFGEHEGTLCQWIILTVESRLSVATRATAVITAGDEEASTTLDIAPGVREYRAHAPTLWPAHGPINQAPVRLVAAGQNWTATVGVGHHRPWSLYLLSDVCTDYCWAYGDEEACRADDARLVEAEMQLAESTAREPEALRNHYNMVVSREVEFYLERYPDQAERLYEHIRRGDITLNPIPNMQVTEDCSLEELIRGLYPARKWSQEHGLDISYANHQETPTIAWAMATVLAECGIGHLVKSILPYECPWAKRLEEPPVFAWEGPDGQRILVRRRNEDYVEGGFVLRGLRATNTAIRDQVLPRYEQLGDRYPFNALALVGCYGDLSPRSTDLPAKKAATIGAYNAQGWTYPRLINASHKQFWDAIDAQIAERHIQVPVVKGEWGTAWDAWPASMAYYLAAWRRAQERAALADKLAAIVATLDEGWYAAHRDLLAEGWANLIYLSDHAWNGAYEENLALNTRLRARWSARANEALDAVIADGLDALGSRIGGAANQATVAGDQLLVFNGLGWGRMACACAPGLEADRLVDVETGRSIPVQVVEREGQRVGCFVPPEVPSVGYRVLAAISPADAMPARSETGASGSPWQVAPNRLEGPFYAVEVSPVTGGIVSLYDKVRGREWVDPASPYHLNQCLYLSEGVEHTPRRAEVTLGACGPVLAQLVVHAELKNTRLTSTLTLYAELDRLDIANELDKEPTAEKQELDFVFSLRAPGSRYQIETPGAIVDPDRDYLPGSGRAYTAIRHFVDIASDDYGLTFASYDSGLVEFGHRTTAEDPLETDVTQSTVFSVALENGVDWHEAVRDQAGQRYFTFRYALRGHQGGPDAPSATRFGWEGNNDLEVCRLLDDRRGPLPSGSHSFVRVEPPNVLLTTLKVAEEEGLVARLWEVAGQESEATIDVAGIGTVAAAYRTDALERGDTPLPTQGKRALVSVRAKGLGTVRLLIESGPDLSREAKGKA